MTYYISYFENGDVISGVGTTEAEARAEPELQIHPGSNDTYYLRTQECTKALYDLVNERGGCISWGEFRVGGHYIACTDEEEITEKFRTRIIFGASESEAER